MENHNWSVSAAVIEGRMSKLGPWCASIGPNWWAACDDLCDLIVLGTDELDVICWFFKNFLRFSRICRVADPKIPRSVQTVPNRLILTWLPCLMGVNFFDAIVKIQFALTYAARVNRCCVRCDAAYVQDERKSHKTTKTKEILKCFQ